MRTISRGMSVGESFPLVPLLVVFTFERLKRWGYFFLWIHDTFQYRGQAEALTIEAVFWGYTNLVEGSVNTTDHYTGVVTLSIGQREGDVLFLFGEADHVVDNQVAADKTRADYVHTEKVTHLDTTLYC